MRKSQDLKSRAIWPLVIFHLSFVMLLLPALQPLLASDPACGYDTGFHLWRAVELEQSLRRGVFFSRWAPDMAHGYGYPLFNFSAPASTYGVALLHLLGLPWPWALNLAFALVLLLSAYGMYLFVGDLFGRYAGLVAGVLYVYAPFHAYDLFYRGGLSQSSAWLFPPLILWALRRADRRVGFVVAALGTGLLLLTHSAFALLFAPLLLAYLLLVGRERGRRTALRGGLALLIGMGLGAFFWLPALAELRFVHSENVSGAWVFEYGHNFLPLDQLFALPRNADPTLLNDWPARGLGLVPTVLALVGLLALCGRRHRLQVAFFTPVMVLFLFLALPASKPIWDGLPLLQRVQFPWRLMGPATLCAAVLAGAAVFRLSRIACRASRITCCLSPFVPPVLAAALVLAHLGWFYPRHCPLPEDTTVAGMLAWEHQTGTVGATALGEFLPIWVEQIPQSVHVEGGGAVGEQPARFDGAVLPEGATVPEADYGPTRALLVVESPVSFRARYLAFYYPGWRVWVDGEPVAVTPTDPEGLISFDLPAGRRQVAIRFGETPLRLAADALSVVALLALAALAFRGPTSKPIRRPPSHPTNYLIPLTLLFLVALSLNLSPSLRGPREWRWAYAIPGRPLRHLIPALTLSAYLAVVIPWGKRIAAAEHRSRWEEGGFLVLLVLAVPLIQAGLLSAEFQDVLKPLFYRTVSTGSSGVFTVGSAIKSGVDFLARYPELMPTFPVHPQRYPPGLPLLFYLARRILERMPALSDGLGFSLRLYQCHDLSLMCLSNATIGAATIQMALPLLVGLTVLPLYGLARRTGGRSVAVWSAVLYPLVPSFALWSARWDQFYPLLACTAWLLFHIGLAESRRRALLAAGLVLSFASLLSFGLLALLLPLGLFALFWLLAHPEHRRWGRLVADTLIFLAGLASLWVVYQLALGTGFLDIWRVSMSFHLGLGRSYWTWLGYHLYDFFIFLGLPLALLFLTALAWAVRDLARRRYAPLALGFGLGLLLLDLAGVARGEVARVWLFLTPFAVITAVHGLARLRRHWRDCAIVALLLAVQLLIFNGFLRVVTTGLTDPPARERSFTPPEVDYPLEARLGEQVAFLGYDLTPQVVGPGGTLHLTLYWQALAPMDRAYTVFAHLVGPGGQLVAQWDNMPLEGGWPTTCWVPGEIVADPYDIPIPSGAAPGDYTLEAGFYILETGERLPVSGPAATDDGRVILATVPVGGN